MPKLSPAEMREVDRARYEQQEDERWASLADIEAIENWYAKFYEAKEALRQLGKEV